jgi:hypothetical protein
MQTHRSMISLVAGIVVLLGVLAPAAPAQDIKKLLSTLNNDDTVKGSSSIRSYELIFDAYLQLEEPPQPIGEFFNFRTIHPGMDGWSDVAAWAESNPTMLEALLEAKKRGIFGLPYGRDNVDRQYRTAELVADVAADGVLRTSNYPWLRALDSVSLFAVAESYRLLEAGEYAQAFNLMSSWNVLLRQCSDRIFLVEKSYSIELLIDALSVFRDMSYMYIDRIPTDEFTRAAKLEMPLLTPGRRHLFMPEGDRIVAEALLRSLIDERDGPDSEKFAEAFSAIQSKDAPLTRFGAARRWKMIADVHGSLEASLDRLTLIYDDWYRRWQVQEYDPILTIETQFERTNPVRYSAVIYSMRDLEQCFALRSRLIMEVNGTAVASALAAYHSYLGTYPDDKEKCYGQFLRGRINDVDPFDLEWGVFKYMQVSGRRGKIVDTEFGRLEVPIGAGVLWSLGANHTDERCENSTSDGTSGDIMLWPPARALAREQGLIE